MPNLPTRILVHIVKHSWCALSTIRREFKAYPHKRIDDALYELRDAKLVVEFGASGERYYATIAGGNAAAQAREAVRKGRAA
jgi:hypothetical protein